MDFFSTFEPKDWVTAILALAAIAISIASLAQNARHHPRPRMTFDWAPSLSVSQGLVVAELTMVNEGSSEARGVRIFLNREATHLWSSPGVNRGAGVLMHIPLAPFEWREDDYGDLARLPESNTSGAAVRVGRPKLRVVLAGERTKVIRPPRFRGVDNGSPQRRLFTISVAALQSFEEAKLDY